MNKRAAPNLPTVLLDDNGYMTLWNSEGQQIDYMGLKLRVTDSVDDFPQVVAIGLCNIARSKEEMIKFYEEEKSKRLKTEL